MSAVWLVNIQARMNCWNWSPDPHFLKIFLLKLSQSNCGAHDCILKKKLSQELVTLKHCWAQLFKNQSQYELPDHGVKQLRKWRTYLCTPRSQQRVLCFSLCSLAAADSRFQRPPFPYQVSLYSRRQWETSFVPADLVRYSLLLIYSTLANFLLYGHSWTVWVDQPQELWWPRKSIIVYYSPNNASSGIRKCREWVGISFAWLPWKA